MEARTPKPLPPRRKISYTHFSGYAVVFLLRVVPDGSGFTFHSGVPLRSVDSDWAFLSAGIPPRIVQALRYQASFTLFAEDGKTLSSGRPFSR